MSEVVCHFYVRVPVTDEPTYRYEHVVISGPVLDGAHHLEHPPAVGDVVLLIDSMDRHSGRFRVVERSWSWSSWGSANWPYVAARPSVGPSLDLIVEPTADVFHDAAPDPD